MTTLNQLFFRRFLDLKEKSLRNQIKPSKQSGQFFDIKKEKVSVQNIEWLNTKEAAAFLKISTKSLLNACSNGQVPYHKFGRRNMYLKSELHELLLASRKGGKNGN
jgi:hypothetical protein